MDPTNFRIKFTDIDCNPSFYVYCLIFWTLVLFFSWKFNHSEILQVFQTSRILPIIYVPSYSWITLLSFSHLFSAFLPWLIPSLTSFLSVCVIPPISITGLAIPLNELCTYSSYSIISYLLTSLSTRFWTPWV